MTRTGTCLGIGTSLDSTGDCGIGGEAESADSIVELEMYLCVKKPERKFFVFSSFSNILACSMRNRPKKINK
jgi:hypothetical protein